MLMNGSSYSARVKSAELDSVVRPSSYPARMEQLHEKQQIALLALVLIKKIFVISQELFNKIAYLDKDH